MSIIAGHADGVRRVNRLNFLEKAWSTSAARRLTLNFITQMNKRLPVQKKLVEFRRRIIAGSARS